MLTKFNRLLLVLLLIGLALYIVMLNRDEVTIKLVPDSPLTANGGVIFIAVFACGILCATFVALFFGMKSYFRERQLQNRDRQRQSFYESMVRARSYLAADDWSRSRDQWEQIVRREPSNVIARIELSRALEGAGEAREALRVLDSARGDSPQNIEVLFRAAELNLALQNKTAAVDNLAMVLAQQPNIKAARMARDLSEDLGRLDDALEYQTQLSNLGEDEESNEKALSRIRYKQLLKEKDGDKAGLKESLATLVKKNPKFLPALQTLAKLEAESGRVEEAAQNLVKAAKISGQASDWREAVGLWLRSSNPEKALAAARAATHGTQGAARINSELFLIRLCIGLHRLDDAQNLLQGFHALLRQEGMVPSKDTLQSYLVLKGYCYNRLGKYEDAFDVWKQLAEADFPLRELLPEERFQRADEGPSPVLSTP